MSGTNQEKTNENELQGTQEQQEKMSCIECGKEVPAYAGYSEVYAALSRAQLEFEPILLNKTNPFHGSRYADLSSVIAVTRPALVKHGLALTQNSRWYEPMGDFALCTELIHGDTGQVIVSWTPFIIDEMKGKSALQGYGSALTYLKRYALCAMLCVVGEEDIDGNDETQQGNKQSGQRKQQKQSGDDRRQQSSTVNANKREENEKKAKAAAADEEKAKEREETQSADEEKAKEKDRAKPDKLDTPGEKNEKVQAIKRAGFAVTKFIGMSDEDFKAECITRYELKESREEMVYDDWKDWITYVESEKMSDDDRERYAFLGKVRTLSTPLVMRAGDEKKEFAKDLVSYLRIRFLTTDVSLCRQRATLEDILTRSNTDANYPIFTSAVKVVVDWVDAVGKAVKTDEEKGRKDRTVGTDFVNNILVNITAMITAAKDNQTAGKAVLGFYELMQVAPDNGVYHLSKIMPEQLKPTTSEDGIVTNAWMKLLEQSAHTNGIEWSGNDVPF